MRSCNQEVELIIEEPKHPTDSVETFRSAERNCRLALGMDEEDIQAELYTRHKLIYKIIQCHLCCLR